MEQDFIELPASDEVGSDFWKSVSPQAKKFNPVTWVMEMGLNHKERKFVRTWVIDKLSRPELLPENVSYQSLYETAYKQLKEHHDN